MGITICSGVGFLAAVGCAGLYDRKSSFLKPFVCGTVFYFFCYILWSMLLFVTNQFTLFRAVLGTAVVLVALLTAAALLLRRKHGTLLRLLHWDESIRTVWIPLVIVLVALPLILTKNELFGMGQDQGVYQVVAINLMNGLTDRQQDFAEYYNLSSADQTEFADAVRNYLMGYDIVPEEYPDTIYDRNISPVSGIYHGIPTYAAMLALFGKLFGISHMIHLETVIWVCMIFLVSFVCRQMQWKRCTGVPRLCGLCSLSHCDLGGEIFPDRTVSGSDFAVVCIADYCTKPQSWAFDFTGGSVCLLSCFDLYDDSIVCGAVWSVVFIPEKAGICRFDAGNDSAVSGKLFCNATRSAILHHE